MRIGSKHRWMTAVFCGAVVFLTAGGVSADVTYLHSEGDFDPGSWSTDTPFTIQPPVGGLTWSVSTARFIGDPEGKFMLQQFSMDVPNGEFAGFYAPVFYGFSLDPSVQGEILNVSASVKTLPVATDASDGVGAIRLWLKQDGKYFVLDPSSPNAATNFPEFEGFSMTDPEETRTATAVIATDFLELIPGAGFDSLSHPDFAGSPIEFGMGYSMTTTDKAGEGPLTVLAAYDSVSFRVTAVPEPATMSLLALGGLAALVQRRRGK